MVARAHAAEPHINTAPRPLSVGAANTTPPATKPPKGLPGCPTRVAPPTGGYSRDTFRS
jgi:hypothetical protein